MISQNKNVLIVDDDDSIHSLFATYLKQLGLNPLHASTIEEGFAVLDTTTITIALIDLHIGAQSGLDMISKIKDSECSFSISLITSDDHDETISNAMEAGADDYILKPVALEDFKHRIHILMAKSKLLEQRNNAIRAAEIAEERYKLVEAGTRDGIWDWNLETNQFLVSHQWMNMLDLSTKDLTGTSEDWIERIHESDQERFKGQLNGHLQGLLPTFECEHRVHFNDGTSKWMLSRGIAKFKDDKAIRIAGSLTDLADKGMADPLTGLPSRRLFLNRLSMLIRRNLRNPDSRYAVAFIDLDGFKAVNDSLGHEAGDAILIEVANRAEKHIRTTDSVARLGGDEFVVLFEDFEDEWEIESLVEKIRSSIAEPHTIGKDTMSCPPSIGIVFGSERYGDEQKVLRDADTAMYRAKAKGGNKIVEFDAAMHERAKNRLRVTNELRQAIFENEFEVYYQPIVPLGPENRFGFEALVRWNHPERGLIYPGAFIEIAEESGMIGMLGYWVVKQSIAQLEKWNQAKTCPRNSLFMSVNVSAHLFKDESLSDTIRLLLDEHDVDPGQVHIEITESAMMEDPDIALAVLTKLKTYDVKIYLDDFGTGYSSFSYLHQFPIDAIKIDRSFITTISKDSKSRKIVWSIQKLAQILNLETVAEGVELKSQWAILDEMGCDYMQGFYFAPAIKKDAAEFMLKSYFLDHSLETIRQINMEHQSSAIPDDGPQLPETKQNVNEELASELEQSTDTLLNYISDHSGEMPRPGEILVIENPLELPGLKAWIPIKGARNGFMMLSMSQGFLTSFSAVAYEQFHTDEEWEYDLAGELTNFVAGRATAITKTKNMTIGVPIINAGFPESLIQLLTKSLDILVLPLYWNEHEIFVCLGMESEA